MKKFNGMNTKIAVNGMIKNEKNGTATKLTKSPLEQMTPKQYNVNGIELKKHKIVVKIIDNDFLAFKFLKKRIRKKTIKNEYCIEIFKQLYGLNVIKPKKIRYKI